MPNKWISFLQAYRKKHPSLSMKQAMKKGAVEWRKSGKGSEKKATKKKGKKKT